MRNKLYPAGLCSKTLGKAARRLGACLLCLLLLATALPLPALADGPEENAWEHAVGDHSDWTELTSRKLTDLNYTLSGGNYYFSSTEPSFSGFAMVSYIPITVTGDVTLCLNNVGYDYWGSTGAAIVVNENASLTICCCQVNDDTYIGYINASSVKYTVDNNGTLNITGGVLSSHMEYGAPIYNASTCTISGGKVSGSAGDALDGYKTAYGVYNEENGRLTITGNPEISGQAPGERIEPTGLQIDVYTSDTITVRNLSTDFEGVKIGFYGEGGDTVVSGVTEETAKLFTVTDPENSELIYNETDGSLTFEQGEVIDYGSLCFAGEPVVNQTKYKIENTETEGTIFSAKLVEVDADADAEDYDLLWDEDTMTLTLNSAEVKASCQHKSGVTDDALISLDCDEETTLTIKGIGKNHLTALNPFSGWNSGFEESRVIENSNGDIIFTGDGSLTVEVVADRYTIQDSDFNVKSMTAIFATGAVNNQVNLTVTGSDEDGICSSMTGVDCSKFTNSGTFKAEISDANSACAVDVSGQFTNEENALFNVTIQGGSSGVGVDCQTFENNGTMDIDIAGEDGAVGIGGYSSANNWTNSGTIDIEVGADGAPVGSLAIGELSRLAGICWGSDNAYSFTNSGTLDVTVTKETASTQNKTQWPVWQLFDTIAVSLMPGGDSTVTNIGTMTLNAHNGYTAGLYVAGANGHSIKLNNSGTMDITVDTLGGENIRAVGIYAEIPAITTGKVGSLPFEVTGGSVRIDAKAADGSSNVMDDACMAVCLVQSFNVGNGPSDTTGLQQIQLNGMTIDNGGSAIVTGPHTVMDISTGVTPTYTSYINTIGNGETPTASVAILPTIEGAVTIQGTLQVGSTLTAQVTGLPDGVQVAYQWQEADSAEGPFTDIKGAVGQTYIPTSDNVGKYLRVVVTPVGDEYGGELTAVTSGTISRPSIPGGTTYPPVIEDSENGTVTTSPSRPEEGDTVTITPKPDEGFEVDEVLVEDEDGNAIKVTQNPDGTYTFTQPDGKVTITVTFRCDGGELCPSYHLTDITKGEWYHAAVDYVVKQGIMAGTSATTFDPNGKLTRAMAVQILYNLEGQPIVTGTTSFADSTAHWAATPIAWAEQTGVVDGYEDNTFRPENNVTRQEFAQMLYNYAAYKGYDLTAKGDLSQFTDGDSVREWAVTAMSWANGNALINGHDDGTLEPGGTTIRAQATSILMRFDQNVVEN